MTHPTPTEAAMAAMRKDFEAWYAPIFKGGEPANMPRRRNGEYLHVQDQIAWMSFQSGRAAMAQEPLFWYRPCGDNLYEGPVHNNSVGGKMLRDEKPGEWVPLYATPKPEQGAALGLRDEVHSLLWDHFPECCGCPAEGHPGDGYLQPPDGPQCCGFPEPAKLNDAQIVRSLRALVPELAAAPTISKESEHG